MRVWPKNRFVAGTYKRECDRCGFDYLFSELSAEFDTKALVCPDCLDPRDNQLYIKARPEKTRHINGQLHTPELTVYDTDNGIFGRHIFGLGLFGE